MTFTRYTAVMLQEVVSLYAKRGHRLIALAKRNLNKSNCDRVQVERAQVRYRSKATFTSNITAD